MKTIIEAVQVERREDGSYFHPSLANSPDDDSAVAFSAWLAECGVEVTRVWMETDAAPLCGRYMDDDTDALKEWHPRCCPGPGPQCLSVRLLHGHAPE